MDLEHDRRPTAAPPPCALLTNPRSAAWLGERLTGPGSVSSGKLIEGSRSSGRRNESVRCTATQAEARLLFSGNPFTWPVVQLPSQKPCANGWSLLGMKKAPSLYCAPRSGPTAPGASTSKPTRVGEKSYKECSEPSPSCKPKTLEGAPVHFACASNRAIQALIFSLASRRSTKHSSATKVS